MERKEENLLQKLQQETVPIPDSLLPENVKKRLEALPDMEGTPHRQGRGRRWLAFSGCCIAAAALFICLLLLNSSFVENNTPQIEAVQNTIPLSAHNAVNAIGNYITAYEKLEAYQSQLPIIRQEQMKAMPDSRAEQSSVAKMNSSATHYTGGQLDYSDTNVRTEGVNEADIVKTDGSFIYTCDKDKHVIEIYRVSGEKVTKISEISPGKQERGSWLEDMYLSGDRLTIICTFMAQKVKQVKKLYEYEGQSDENFNKTSWLSTTHSFGGRAICETASRKYSETPDYLTEHTVTYVYDISSRKEPALLHTFFQDGSYSGSRMSENILYLFSQRQFNTKALEYQDITSYIPQIGGECVAPPDVTVPEKNSVNQYTCIAAIDPASCDYLSKNSVLGGTALLYASTENIYLMDYRDRTPIINLPYQEETAEDSLIDCKEGTSIIKLHYQKGTIEKIAENTVKGTVLNDYSTDEKNGCLRLVTTYRKSNSKTYNGLFILDENLKLTGKITDLAKNEELYSARFIDDIAYFVTYENTDPLFAVDVSNPSAPKLLGHLEIPGFSEYLHPYGDHLLLGIGEETNAAGTWIGLKLSMFDITNPSKLKETHKLVLPKELVSATVTSDPNALFIDTEKNLFGFAIENYVDNKTNYLVFSYDEEKGFTTKLDTAFSESYTPCRGLYIEDKFYVVGVGKGVKVFELGSFERLN